MPEVTEQEAIDLVLLRKHYGIGAHDAYLTLPEWEIDLLLAAIPDRHGTTAENDPDDPWAAPPQDLIDHLPPMET